MKRFAQYLYAIGAAGLGLLSLISGDFALNWQPVPPDIPARRVLAYISGALLLAGGLGLMWKRTSRCAAAGLTAFIFLWLLVLQIPRVIPHPTDVGVWLGFCETLMLVSGGWLLFAFLSLEEQKKAGFVSGDRAIVIGKLFFALALPLIGVSHFVYVEATASMVPSWLPARTGIAYLTGVSHIAAGVAMLLGIVPRLAATLEAIMLSLFVLLLHLPGVASAPSNRFQWTMLFVASALTASAWATARAWSTAPWAAWGSKRR